MDLDHAENKYLLSSAADGSISAFDTQQPSDAHGEHEPLFVISKQNNPDAHTNSVSCVCWYPIDCGMFISGGRDKSVKVWDANAATAAFEFDVASPVHVTAMSPVATGHCLVAIGSDAKDVTLCDIASGASTHVLSGHRAAVWTVSWSPQAEYELVTGARDGQMRLWDIRRASGAMHVFDVQETSPTQSTEASKRSALREESSSMFARAHSRGITGLIPTPDGLYWISAGNDDQVRLWDATTHCNLLVNYSSAYNRATKPRQLATSDCGRALFFPSGSVVKVLDVTSGSEIRLLKGGHFESIHACVWNASLQELYTGGNDRAIVVWAPKLLSLFQGNWSTQNDQNSDDFDCDNWTESESDY